MEQLGEITCFYSDHYVPTFITRSCGFITLLNSLEIKLYNFVLYRYSAINFSL